MQFAILVESAQQVAGPWRAHSPPSAGTEIARSQVGLVEAGEGVGRVDKARKENRQRDAHFIGITWLDGGSGVA
jgi:hypothetical protein